MQDGYRRAGGQPVPEWPQDNVGVKGAWKSLSGGSNKADRFMITVYRNKDEYDEGTKVPITRSQFHNWLSLLDYLTQRLQLTDGAVERIYDLDGNEIRQFRQFQNNGHYVAAHGRFRSLNYGGNRSKRPPFGVRTALPDNNLDAGRLGIYSEESLRNYLRKMEFQPTLGDVWDNSQFDLRTKPPPSTLVHEIPLDGHSFHKHNDTYANNVSGYGQANEHYRMEAMNGARDRLENVNGIRGKQSLLPTLKSRSVEREYNQTKSAIMEAPRQPLQQSDRMRKAVSAANLQNGDERVPIWRRNDYAKPPPPPQPQPTRPQMTRGQPEAANRRIQEDTTSYDILEIPDELQQPRFRQPPIRYGRPVIRPGRPQIGPPPPPNIPPVSRRLVIDTQAVEDDLEAGVNSEDSPLANRPPTGRPMSRNTALVDKDEQVVPETKEQSTETAKLTLTARKKKPQPAVRQQVSPVWATELTNAVRELAGEVHHLHPPMTTETLRNFSVSSKKADST